MPACWPAWQHKLIDLGGCIAALEDALQRFLFCLVEKEKGLPEAAAAATAAAAAAAAVVGELASIYSRIKQ